MRDYPKNSHNREFTCHAHLVVEKGDFSGSLIGEKSIGDLVVEPSNE